MIEPESLISRIKEYITDFDEKIIKDAYIFALDRHGTQIRESGDPFFSHPLEVAKILIELKMDIETIVAGILHDTVEDTNTTIEEIKENFGLEIAKIVDGVTKLSKFEISSISEKHTENFKKLLISAASDLRILVIKLADRLHNMKTLKFKKKKYKRHFIAKETLEIYAPLAERAGITKLKDELQDIAFMELYPDIYNSIQSRLKHLYETSEQITKTINLELNKLIQSLDIPCSINGRLKTPYSIWNKMNIRNISFEQLADIMAFRIIVENVHQCYQILGIIHRNYLVVPGRFRDYISTPKINNYQSLHTSVIGPLNKRIELQIRTKEMHLVSEYGIAAHWNYKSNNSENDKAKIEPQWLKNLIKILENDPEMTEFFENSKSEILSDQIFCVTPKGSLVSVPKGASVLDFAYAIHSEVGNHAIAAEVNGKSVSLKTIVENGDQIEILTDSKSSPKQSWENYVITVKAKSALKKALNSIQKEHIEMIGKSNFDEFFRKYNLEILESDITQILKKLKLETKNHLFYEIGSGSITMSEILSFYNQIKKNKLITSNQKDNELDSKITTLDVSHIIGIPNVSIVTNNCCSPVAGDKIIGVIEGKKIEIHIEECYILKEQESNPNTEIVDLSWRKSAFNSGIKYLTKLVVMTNYEPGNLSKIADIIEQKNAEIINLKIGEKWEGLIQLNLEIEVLDIAQLTVIIANLRSLHFINKVYRG